MSIRILVHHVAIYKHRWPRCVSLDVQTTSSTIPPVEDRQGLHTLLLLSQWNQLSGHTGLAESLDTFKNQVAMIERYIDKQLYFPSSISLSFSLSLSFPILASSLFIYFIYLFIFSFRTSTMIILKSDGTTYILAKPKKVGLNWNNDGDTNLTQRAITLKYIATVSQGTLLPNRNGDLASTTSEEIARTMILFQGW